MCWKKHSGWAALLVLTSVGCQMAADLIPTHHQIHVDKYAACDGTTDATAGVASALTAAAGQTLRIPAGCQLLSASPAGGAGTATFTIPSGTTIECEDHSAGFVLARRSCVGGHYPGAWCTGDADCLGGGTCVYDVGSNAFARAVVGDSYTLLAAEVSGQDIQVKGCSIWARGVEPYRRCVGGTNAGKPCMAYCDGSHGVACDADADCVADTAGTTCLQLADCVGAGGYCGAEPGSPVGLGKVTPIDLSAGKSSAVEDVYLWDHRRGLLAVGVGSNITNSFGTYGRNRIEKVQNALTTLGSGGSATGLPISVRCTGCLQAPAWYVETGLSIIGDGEIVRNDIRAVTTGITATAGTGVLIQHNHVDATDPTTSTAISSTQADARIEKNRATAVTTGIYSSGAGSSVVNNNAQATHATAGYGIFVLNGSQHVTGNTAIGKLHAVHSDGLGNDITGNYITGATATAGSIGVWLNGQQQRVVANYIAANIAIKGSPLDGHNVTVIGNRAFGGTGPKVVVQGTGWDIVGNYLAWNTANGRGIIELGSTDTEAGPASHPEIIGNKFFSEQAGASAITFIDTGKRCNRGPKIRQACATNDCNASTGCPGATGCPTSCTGTCCAATIHDSFLIGANNFLAVTTGIDFTGLTSGDTTAYGITIAANRFGGQKTGIAFPPTDANLVNASIKGNDFMGASTPQTNWAASMGEAPDFGTTHLWLPDYPVEDQTTAFPAANVNRCVKVVARDTILRASKLAFGITAKASAACSVGIFSEDGSTRLAVSDTENCSTTGPKSTTGLNLTLYAGNKYTLCICNNSSAGSYSGIGAGTRAGSALELSNVFVTNAGTGTSCTSGVQPTTTGALTPSAVVPPIVLISNE